MYEEMNEMRRGEAADVMVEHAPEVRWARFLSAEDHWGMTPAEWLLAQTGAEWQDVRFPRREVSNPCEYEQWWWDYPGARRSLGGRRPVCVHP